MLLWKSQLLDMLEQHVGVWGNTVFQHWGGLWEKEWSSNFSLDLTLLGCDSFTAKATAGGRENGSILCQAVPVSFPSGSWFDF